MYGKCLTIINLVFLLVSECYLQTLSIGTLQPERVINDADVVVLGKYEMSFRGYPNN
jgi:hypothetical protein